MSLVKVALRWVSSLAVPVSSEHGLRADLGAGAGARRCVHHLFSVRLMLLVTGMALAFMGGVERVHAAPSISNITVFPSSRADLGAAVDGTSRTLFVFTCVVTPAADETIATTTGWEGAPPTSTYVTIGSWPMWRIGRGPVSSDEYSRGGGVYRACIQGYRFASDSIALPGGTASLTITARSAHATATPTLRSGSGTAQVRVTGRGRGVLIPVDAQGNSDQFKTPKKAGGITVQPGYPDYPGDGSASATYTFRVRYIDPEGLPPKPFNRPYNVLDELGPNGVDLGTGVEMDGYNVPRRLDDPWRYPTPTDPTLPAGVAPPTYRSGIYIVFDDNNDGIVNPNPIFWRYPGDPPALTGSGDAPRFMEIDYDLQPQFLERAPTPNEWRTGVIYRYTVRPNDHAVSIGIPRYFELGASVFQELLSPFSYPIAQKYVNPGRVDPGRAADPTARSFVSLNAGLRRYSFFTSNDIMPRVAPPSPSPSSGWGYFEGALAGAAEPYDSPLVLPRYFQQPNLNAPLIDPQSPPRQVFLPPFEIRVDPQISVEQRQLRRDPDPASGIGELLLIGIPSAVHAREILDPATGTLSPTERDLFVTDAYRGTPTRFTIGDQISWRFYYTQSEGVPPGLAELHLLRQDASGSFVPVPGSPFACQALATGAAGRDPVWSAYPDPTHIGAYYGQYGTSFAGSSPNLGPGVYRYFFRASDGRRVVEWPGDSAGGSSLATIPWRNPVTGVTEPGVSHVANTLRINAQPQVTIPAQPAVSSVDAKTGRITWSFSATYTDADNDPPRRSYLIFPAPPGSGQGDLVLVMVKEDVNDNNYRDGVKYKLVSTTDPSVGAFSGRRDYYFSFTDNWRSVANPEEGETARQPVTGTLTLNSPPFVKDLSVTPTTGGLGETYTFTATYGDSEGDAPSLDGNGAPLVWLTVDGGSTRYPMTTADPAPVYTTGVQYTVSIPGRTLGPGAHTFEVFAESLGNAPGTTLTASAQGTGPSIYTPKLGDASVMRDGLGGPAVGSPQTNWVYRVRYRHDAGTGPVFIKVYVLNPDGSPLTEIALQQEPPASPTDTIQQPGLFYSNSGAPYQFNAPGNYKYYFEASDGDSVGRFPTTGALDGPVVAAPGLTALAPTPANGVNAAPFVFRALYTHPGGAPPVGNPAVRVRVISPTGQQNEYPMTPESNQPASEIVSPGWTYVSGDVSLTEVGIYHYTFLASDGSTNIDSGLIEGPTVVAVERPVLSNASVQPLPDNPGRVTYRLTYRQAQGLVPSIYLVLNNQPYLMTQENASGASIVNGVTFAVTVDRPAGAGPHSYYFIVRGPGIDERYPTGSDVAGPNAFPMLIAPAQGTVTPTTGHTATKFLFRVICTDVDATEDPRVFVVVGNQKLAMKKVSGDARQAGAEYQLETTLPAGSLVHSFTATDGVDTVRLPADGSFPGPNVLQATALNAALSATSLRLDGATPIQVAGVTAPAIPSAEITVTYSHPAGESVTQKVNAGSDGRYSDSFIPNRSGTWTVKVECQGDGVNVGGGVETLTIPVDPNVAPLAAGHGLIGIPVTPDGGTLESVITGGVFQIARWNGEGYDYGGSGVLPAVAPGVGFWINSTVALQGSTVGRTVNHNQAFSVPVKKGWNQVANPFLVPISWSAVVLETGSGQVPLAQARAEGLALDHGWVYDGRTNQYVLVHGTVGGATRSILPWQGVWFKSNVNGQLVFAPPSRAAVPAPGADRRRERGSERQWTIQVVASNGQQSDSYNFAGVTSEGRGAAYSGLESPPPVGSYVDLYFTAPGAGRRYATDYRAPAAGEQVWEMVVETDITDRPITVTVPNLAEVPKSLEVLLEDADAAGKRVYLRNAGGYTFNPGGNNRRNLRLIVRPRSTGLLTISDVTVTPSRGGGAIGYVVSRDALVSVEVVSPSGRRLKLVADRQAATQGRSSVVWDGTRDDGARLPAGIYLVQVTATTSEGPAARVSKPIAVTR